jgi:hypothetical protein
MYFLGIFMKRIYVIACISAVLSVSGLSAMIRRHEPTSTGVSYQQNQDLKMRRVLEDAWNNHAQFSIDRLAYGKVLPKTLVKFNEITQELAQESIRYPHYAPAYTHALQSLNILKQHFDNNPITSDSDSDSDEGFVPRRLIFG